MAFNLKTLGNKLLRYRSQFQYSISDVAHSTGISESILEEIEKCDRRPTGDQVLILADFYKCDFKFFLSNEKLASFEQTESLFRKFGSEFSKKDRWSVQECLFLAECESNLDKYLKKTNISQFEYTKSGTHFKTHGKLAAKALRKYLNYPDTEVSMNIYSDLRKIGIRVFRRKLENSNISGLFLKHPVAGKCVLINYSEDIYRQRFTAAHEAAHAILDIDDDVLVSFSWDKRNLKEVRANTFASAYLIPQNFIKKIPECHFWTTEKAIDWANKLKVSTQALAIALSESKLIEKDSYSIISKSKVPNSYKEDPELPNSLAPRSKIRKRFLLENGLSDYYVSLCFDAYRKNSVSASRLSEMLLLETDRQLVELAEIYGEKIQYAT